MAGRLSGTTCILQVRGAPQRSPFLHMLMCLRALDYVILKLASPAFIHGVNIDTAHFDGNYAPGASVEGLVLVERNKR